MRRSGMVLLLFAVALAAGGCVGRGGQDGAGPSPPEVLSVTPSGLQWVDAISTDAQWLVGTEPREEGATSAKPLIRLDRTTGEQTVLCDWSDPELGYCSLAEQGGMVSESPHLLLELRDDNAVRGWFPDGGIFLVDTSDGARTRIDADADGNPLKPTWAATGCREACDYHQAPRVEISTDAISADGHVAAFCANYESPREPLLYVKDLVTGDLTRTDLRCGVNRFGREDDDDEFNDEGMSGPRISADGGIVHVQGDRSSGGEYGLIGWRADSLYLTGAAQIRTLPGSGSMTRDGSTVILRSGQQAEIPEGGVVPEYVSYDVATAEVTPLEWMAPFLATSGSWAPLPDLTVGATSDGRLLISGLVIHNTGTGSDVDVGSLLREGGYRPTTEWRPLRISGDGSTVVADVIEGDPLSESAGNAAVLVSGWGSQPTARATLTPIEEQTALQIDIDPDDVEGPWTFQIERATQDSVVSEDWVPLPESYTSAAPEHMVAADLPTGVYRVHVPAQHGHRALISAGVWVAPEPDEQ